MAFPQVFLFDMDGLLLDTERVFLDLARDLLVPRGHDPKDLEMFFLTLVGSSSKLTKQRLAAFLGGAAEAAAFEAEWYDALKTKLAQTVPVKPTVREALDQLSGQGARMAVVTSTKGANARHHLEVAGLLGHFERVTGGDEVSANKPDPAPYLETAAALGVDPSQCMAFEDSDRGTTAAVKAGCRTVQIPDLRPAGQPLPDLGQHIAPDLMTALRDLQIFPNVGAI